MVVDKKYYRKIRKIIKTYNSILVKCKTIPKLSDKNIIMVESMDGMINAEIETRKPILYFMENESVSFMLLDGTETYIHIIKMHDGVQSAVEQIISNMENAKNTFVKEILSNLENILLTGNVEKGDLLLVNELKYLGSVKEETIQLEAPKKKRKTKKEEAQPTEELHLVPVKKQRKTRVSKKDKAEKNSTKKVKSA